MEKGIFGMGFAQKGVMKRILFVSLAIFLMTEVSFAEVYRWVDENGMVHFTDDLIQVPEKYRPKAERVGLPGETGESKIEGGATPKKKEEPYRDRLGRGEEYWKGRVEEWRKKLMESQERLELLRAKYNELTERYNDSKSTAERGALRKEREQVKNEMDQCKIRIDEAKDIIEKKIPEEAELYKAKPEWIKQ
jgi:hypothetical protein